MAADGRSSAGGRANEVGSVYRAAFGAYLISYGLTDREVWFDSSTPGAPRWLWFESDAPVDDLAAEFSSGARWDIQATASCDWDAKFRATVDQWVGAVRSGRLGSDDRVALAAGKVSARLLELRDALRRVREGGIFTPPEQTAIDRLRQDATDRGWLDDFDAVVRSAAIIELDCATETSPGFREAAALIDGTVVATGSGTTAVSALRDFVHVEAQRAGSSRPDRWIKVVANVPLQLEQGAVAAPGLTAVLLAEYSNTLAAELDRLPLTFLGVAAESLHIDDLVDRFRVELPGVDSDGRTRSGSLASVARRWPALCVVGAAGAGKSTAMRQLAAAWAADADAPVPIVVPLYRLIRPLREREPLTLAKVVERGLGVDAELVPILVGRMQAGTAALVLDGLDECRDQQDAAVELIRGLAEGVHPSAGLIVSARDAVAVKAEATGLPVTTLAEPHHLSGVADEIVALVMKATRPGHTAAELAEARSWMSQSQSDHPDLWKVPLFSALLAAHAGRTPSSALPSSRAEALVAAIKDSVGTWEAEKHAEPKAWQADLTPAKLIDGFTAIGHATAGGSATRGETASAIVDVFSSRWSMSTAEAEETAEEVLAWWVGRVGAFTDQDGDVRPTLRLFGEIADAMWASAQPDPVAIAWMKSAVADVSQYREPILLAASLSAVMRSTFMTAATAPDAVLLAARAIGVGIEASDEELLVIAQRLFTLADPPPPGTKGHGIDRLFAAVDRRRAEQDGPTWRFRLALAELPPRGAVGKVKAVALDTEPADERKLVLGTFMAVAACRLESRAPTTAENAVLQRLLDLPVPERAPPPITESRRHIVFHTSPPIVSGRLAAMTGAIGLVGLTDAQAEAAVVMCGRGSMDDVHTLSTAIQGAGYRDLVTRKGPMAGIVAAMKAFTSAYDEDLQTIYILEQAVSAVTHRAPEPSWRLENAAALLGMLSLEHQHVGDVGWAVDHHPAEVEGLVQLATQSPELDRAQLAADALAAQEIVRKEPLSGWLFLLLPADPRRAVTPSWPAATSADLSWLRECVRCPSHWLNAFGAYLISNMTDIDGDTLLLEEIDEINAVFRQQLAAAVLADATTEELNSTWFAHSDPRVRAAAAEVLATRPLEPSVLEAIASDPDLTVRLAMLLSSTHGTGDTFERVAEIAVRSEPSFWTCTDCGATQAPENQDCDQCTRGTRTNLSDEIKRIRDMREKEN